MNDWLLNTLLAMTKYSEELETLASLKNKYTRFISEKRSIANVQQSQKHKNTISPLLPNEFATDCILLKWHPHDWCANDLLVDNIEVWYIYYCPVSRNDWLVWSMPNINKCIYRHSNIHNSLAFDNANWKSQNNFLFYLCIINFNIYFCFFLFYFFKITDRCWNFTH